METSSGDGGGAPPIPPGSPADLRQRMKKKSRGADGSPEYAELPEKVCSPEKRKGNYKGVLIGEMDTVMEIAPMGDVEELISEEELGFDSDEEAGEDEDPLCPKIHLSAAEKRILWKPWSTSLIVKVLGKKVGFHFLKQKIQSFWVKEGVVNLIDLANDFYIAKFSNENDYWNAINGGPYLVADHVLSIQPWKPNFDPYDAEVKHILTWVRFPDLPIEYYNQMFLHKLASKVGKVKFIDRKSLEAERGKFARVCVEVDLNQRLLAKYQLRRRTKCIEYEGLHSICFDCGRYGHLREQCPESKKNTGNPTMNPSSSSMNNVIREVVTDNYGPFMMARKPRRNRSKAGASNDATVDDKIAIDKTMKLAESMLPKLGGVLDLNIEGEHNVGDSRPSRVDRAPNVTTRVGTDIQQTQPRPPKQNLNGSGSRFEILHSEMDDDAMVEEDDLDPPKTTMVDGCEDTDHSPPGTASNTMKSTEFSNPVFDSKPQPTGPKTQVPKQDSKEGTITTSEVPTKMRHSGKQKNSEKKLKNHNNVGNSSKAGPQATKS